MLGTRFVFCAFVICLGLAVTPAARALDESKGLTAVSFDRPPRDIADALRDLLSADFEKRASAETALARLPDAEPFLRAYCATPGGKGNTAARRALEVLHDARTRRNVKRITGWAKDGRYDLLVDAGVHLTDEGQADVLGGILLDFGKAIRPLPKRLGGPGGKHYIAESMDQFARQYNFQRWHRPDGLAATKDYSSSCYVRARECETSALVRFNWLVLTRDRLVGTKDAGDQWENCFIFHNGDVAFDGCPWSLVVCDGDVTFGKSAWGAPFSTIIARGSIYSEGKLRFDNSTFYAGGDIVAKGSSTMDGLLLAGGKIDVPATLGAEKSKERVEKAGVKECPFPVRFFETVDVGTEAAFKDGTLTVTKLTPGSPLTKYGVKEGDVVTRLNDKDIKTANDFRRELRYSVALEAGIFHITRGNEKTTRVVYFKNGLEK